jgi:hypothetical protein
MTSVETCVWAIPLTRQRPRKRKNPLAVVRRVWGRRSSPELEIHTGIFGGYIISFRAKEKIYTGKQENIAEKRR